MHADPISDRQRSFHVLLDKLAKRQSVNNCWWKINVRHDGRTCFQRIHKIRRAIVGCSRPLIVFEYEWKACAHGTHLLNICWWYKTSIDSNGTLISQSFFASKAFYLVEETTRLVLHLFQFRPLFDWANTIDLLASRSFSLLLNLSTKRVAVNHNWFLMNEQERGWWK